MYVGILRPWRGVLLHGPPVSVYTLQLICLIYYTNITLYLSRAQARLYWYSYTSHIYDTNDIIRSLTYIIY